MHTLLFTGHLIDSKNRKSPRFPAEKESLVKDAMTNQIMEINAQFTNLIGIAGGASGGDILFHEICAMLNIPTEIYLGLSVEDFMSESVSPAGAHWEKRYMNLIDTLPVHIYKGLKEGENVWEQTNLWMLRSAMKDGPRQATLLALWDGKEGDGPGGVAHFIEAATQSDVKVKTIDIKCIIDRLHIASETVNKAKK
ncbi:hypothetical protein [Flavobacterium sp.]|uniref:hypothetical protein n=1 Tax=Flavobacterium sp. TaxID=239 RepID=UPI00262B3BA9|nr:hypothetical protein [Flavobacterium sp.]